MPNQEILDCIVVTKPPKVEVQVPHSKYTKEERRKMRIESLEWEMEYYKEKGPWKGARSVDEMEKEMEELKAQRED